MTKPTPLRRVKSAVRSFIDMDGDGMVNKDELLTIMLKINEEDGDKLEENVEKVFQIVDANASGNITYSEYAKAEKEILKMDSTSRGTFGVITDFMSKTPEQQAEIIARNEDRYQHRREELDKKRKEEGREERKVERVKGKKEVHEERIMELENENQQLKDRLQSLEEVDNEAEAKESELSNTVQQITQELEKANSEKQTLINELNRVKANQEAMSRELEAEKKNMVMMERKMASLEEEVKRNQEVKGFKKFSSIEERKTKMLWVLSPPVIAFVVGVMAAKVRPKRR